MSFSRMGNHYGYGRNTSSYYGSGRGASGDSIRFCGPYLATTAYNYLNIVSYSGNLYIRNAFEANIAKDKLPTDTTYFDLALGQSDIVNSLGGGLLSGCEITTGTATCSVAEGTALLRTTNSPISSLVLCNVTATTDIELIDSSLNYLILTYGDPNCTISASLTEPNGNNEILIAVLYRDGDTVNLYSSQNYIQNLHNNICNKYGDKAIIERVSGGFISCVNRKLLVSNMKYYSFLNSNTFSDFDSSGESRFKSMYYNGTNYTVIPSQSDINNVHYENNGVLASLTGVQYGVRFIYFNISNTTGEIIELISPFHGDLDNAQQYDEPNLYGNYQYAICLGKIIIQNSASTIDAANIKSSFPKDWSYQAVATHNNLSTLQGGTTNEYYHLTQAQHDVVANFTTTPTFDGVKTDHVDEKTLNHGVVIEGTKFMDSWVEMTPLKSLGTDIISEVTTGYGTAINGALIDNYTVRSRMIEEIWSHFYEEFYGKTFSDQWFITATNGGEVTIGSTDPSHARIFSGSTNGGTAMLDWNGNTTIYKSEAEATIIEWRYRCGETTPNTVLVQVGLCSGDTNYDYISGPTGAAPTQFTLCSKRDGGTEVSLAIPGITFDYNYHYWRMYYKYGNLYIYHKTSATNAWDLISTVAEEDLCIGHLQFRARALCCNTSSISNTMYIDYVTIWQSR